MRGLQPGKAALLFARDLPDQPAAEEHAAAGQEPLNHVGTVKVPILLAQDQQLAVEQIVLKNPRLDLHLQDDLNKKAFVLQQDLQSILGT